MSALVIGNTVLGAVGSYVLRRAAESVVLGRGGRCPRICCGCGSRPWTGPSRVI